MKIVDKYAEKRNKAGTSQLPVLYTNDDLFAGFVATELKQVTAVSEEKKASMNEIKENSFAYQFSDDKYIALPQGIPATPRY